MYGRNPIREWLNSEAWHRANYAPGPEDLRELTIPFDREKFDLEALCIIVPTLHPLRQASVITWEKDTEKTTRYDVPHDWDSDDPIYYGKPVQTIIFSHGYAIRRNYIGTGACLGAEPDIMVTPATTDYVAMRLSFALLPGKVGMIAMCTQRPDGFSPEQLWMLDDSLAALSRITELHLFSGLTRTLLNTYLGETSGQLVLDGQIRRGDGIDLKAAIWFCDLRDSTALSMTMPRHEFLATLNDYFDCTAGAVLETGGQILRYIGDAVLAIFPTSPEGDTPYIACTKAMAATQLSYRNLAALNHRRQADGKIPLNYGIGIHFGEVTYGNVGVQQRLEFTVVGEAANWAAGLQKLCKTLGSPLVVSKDFVLIHGGTWVQLGEMFVAGDKHKVPVFTTSIPDAPHAQKG